MNMDVNQENAFPGDVVPFTTFCHECTPIFSDSQKFSESSRFSETSLFSESTKFSPSFEFTESNLFQEKFSLISDFPFYSFVESLSSESLSYSDDEPGLNPGNQGSNSKGMSKAAIGAIAAVAAVVVIAAVVATVIINKRRKVDISTEEGKIETQDTVRTTENNLKSIMKDDDPFAEDFRGDELKFLI